MISAEKVAASILLEIDEVIKDHVQIFSLVEISSLTFLNYKIKQNIKVVDGRVQDLKVQLENLAELCNTFFAHKDRLGT